MWVIVAFFKFCALACKWNLIALVSRTYKVHFCAFLINTRILFTFLEIMTFLFTGTDLSKRIYLNPRARGHRYYTNERESPWSEFSRMIVRVRKRTETRRSRRRFDAVRYLRTCCCWREIIKHWGSYVRLVIASWQWLCFPQVMYILYSYIV